jgi:hypothetical protein
MPDQIRSNLNSNTVGDSTTRALLVIFPPNIVIEGIRCSDPQPGMALVSTHLLLPASKIFIPEERLMGTKTKTPTTSYRF